MDWETSRSNSQIHALTDLKWGLTMGLGLDISKCAIFIFLCNNRSSVAIPSVL